MSETKFTWKRNGINLPERLVRKTLWFGTRTLQKAKRVCRAQTDNVFRSTVYKIYDYPPIKQRRQKNRLKRLLHRFYGWDPRIHKPSAIEVALILREGTTFPKSSAFIRLISPLTDPRISEKISLKIYDQWTTDLPESTQVCIVQRNVYDNLRDAELLVDNLKAIGCKLVLDSDDAFHDIDSSHPEHAKHRLTLEPFVLLAENASQIWPSTEQLAKHFRRINPSVFVVPNSLDKRIWVSSKTNKGRYNDHKPIQILYMGTISHDADFKLVFPALDKIATKFPGTFELTVIGVANNIPDRAWIKRLYQKRGGSLYPLFVQWLLHQGPYDIGLSPLVNTSFNMGKSDIKCLDYLAAGIVPMVSDIAPYKSKELAPYVIKLSYNQDEWEKRLAEIVTDPRAFRREYTQIIDGAHNYISGKRSASDTAGTLLDLLTAVIKD